MNAVLPALPKENDARKIPATPLSFWMFPSVLAVVAWFDFCFWRAKDWPGLSLAVFVAALALAIGVNRPAGSIGRRGGMFLVLLAGAIMEAAIETGFCNGLMLVMLIAAFSAETFFRRFPIAGERWLAQMLAFVLAPVRAVHLGLRVAGGLLMRAGLAGKVAAVAVVAVPTLVLLLLFGTLLANGNAVFGLWAQQGFAWIWRLWPEVSVPRVVLWIVVGIGAVSLLWPSDVGLGPREWNSLLARWPEVLPARLALGTSLVLLAALNAMFAVANVADAIFLWQGGRLPVGVTYSAFVHQGAEVLIVTALLSALVLATVFNQAPAVASRRMLQALGLLWVAQNLFLIVSTTRRLLLYIEAYGATVERFSTLLFLVLVTVGFGLLVTMIRREKTLGWLVARAAGASFATLYLAQFLNLAGWAADEDVARWEANRETKLDVLYLESLGPAAWPALARVQRLEPGKIASEDDRANWSLTPIDQEKACPRTELVQSHWREFSARAWWNRSALDAW